MIEELAKVQTLVHRMREVVLNEDRVNAVEECFITHLEVKKKALWYLDLLAAAVAGAHRHISNFEHDDVFSGTEKDEMQKKIIDRLQQEYEVLLAAIKYHFYKSVTDFECFEAYDFPPPLDRCTQEDLSEKREIIKETFDTLVLLNEDVDDLLPCSR